MGGITETKPTSIKVPVASLNREDLVQEALQIYNIPLTEMKMTTGLELPVAGDSTYLGMAFGTHGSAAPYLVGTVTNTDSKTEVARLQFILPPEYEDGQSVSVRLHARVDVARQASASVDVQCYKVDKEIGVGSDICATAAQSINTDVWADKDFTITPTGLVAGDLLDIEITGVGDDTGGSSNGYVQIGAVQMLLDIKG